MPHAAFVGVPTFILAFAYRREFSDLGYALAGATSQMLWEAFENQEHWEQCKLEIASLAGKCDRRGVLRWYDMHFPAIMRLLDSPVARRAFNKGFFAAVEEEGPGFLFA